MLWVKSFFLTLKKYSSIINMFSNKKLIMNSKYYVYRTISFLNIDTMIYWMSFFLNIETITYWINPVQLVKSVI
jgi:hypothetical protein